LVTLVSQAQPRTVASPLCAPEISPGPLPAPGLTFEEAVGFRPGVAALSLEEATVAPAAAAEEAVVPAPAAAPCLAAIAFTVVDLEVSCAFAIFDVCESGAHLLQLLFRCHLFVAQLLVGVTADAGPNNLHVAVILLTGIQIVYLTAAFAFTAVVSLVAVLTAAFAFTAVVSLVAALTIVVSVRFVVDFGLRLVSILCFDDSVGL